MSRACLEVFASTHDFFALHLVTSSHAFRVCAPFAGADAAAFFSLGLAAGYLAIGAPDFEPLARSSTHISLAKAAGTSDEHDTELAYSCSVQARALGDETFLAVAAKYLSR